MIDIKNCPVCSATSFSKYTDTKDFFFTKEVFSISKCNECGFVFTNPVPDTTSIGKYYETEKYLSHNSESGGLISSIYSKVRGINLKKKYTMVSNQIAKGKILDIGCGTGELLAYFKNREWEAVGIEPSNSARKIAREKYKIEVDGIDGLKKLGSGDFDIVSMWHVLEHVYDLQERMQTVYRLLKSNGKAFIALPMIDSPDSLKFGKYWAGLDVPRHLHHFSSNTFELLTKRNDFRIVAKYPMKFDSFYVSWLSYQAKGKSLAFPLGLAQGLLSNLRADKNSNYSSMIFVIEKRTNL